jgi:hypothetical protein
MKIFRFIILCVTAFSVITLFSGCWSTHYFRFPAENETAYEKHISKPFVSLLKSSNNDYFISVNFDINTAYQIEDFEFDNGFIKIGEQEIIFNKDDISINIYANTMWNSVYWLIKGKRHVSKLSDPVIAENEANNSIIHYIFRFNKSNITNKEIKIIINEYKKNQNTKLFFKFTILMNNEIIVYDLTEEYNIEIETQNWNIFKVTLFSILMSGNH